MNLEEDLVDYIYMVTSKIIKSEFNIDIGDDIKNYCSFINDSRKQVIEKYRVYGLISPSIFNVCFLILTKYYLLSRKEVMDALDKPVEYNKKQMQLILKYNYEPQEYKEIKHTDETEKKNICIMCRSKELCTYANNEKMSCDFFRSLKIKNIEPIRSWSN